MSLNCSFAPTRSFWVVYVIRTLSATWVTTNSWYCFPILNKQKMRRSVSKRDSVYLLLHPLLIISNSTSLRVLASGRFQRIAGMRRPCLEMRTRRCAKPGKAETISINFFVPEHWLPNIPVTSYSYPEHFLGALITFADQRSA